jgi:hypothetical protein
MGASIVPANATIAAHPECARNPSATRILTSYARWAQFTVSYCDIHNGLKHLHENMCVLQRRLHAHSRERGADRTIPFALAAGLARLAAHSPSQVPIRLNAPLAD